MKYFTMADWLADQELDGQPAAVAFAARDAYDAYLQRVRPALPADFRQMLDTVCIHDARLLELRADVPGRRVALTLDAGDVTMREGRRVRLWYEDVRQLVVPADPPDAFAGVGFGNLGNDEVEVLADGSYEHRILWERGIEWVVHFGGFRLEVLAQPTPGELRVPAA